jgi:hypothetical protein
LLLDAGADPLALGGFREQTALQMAKSSGHSEVVHLLEEHLARL